MRQASNSCFGLFSYIHFFGIELLVSVFLEVLPVGSDPSVLQAVKAPGVSLGILDSVLLRADPSLARESVFESIESSVVGAGSVFRDLLELSSVAEVAESIFSSVVFVGSHFSVSVSVKVMGMGSHFVVSIVNIHMYSNLFFHIEMIFDFSNLNFILVLVFCIIFSIF